MKKLAMLVALFAAMVMSGPAFAGGCYTNNNFVHRNNNSVNHNNYNRNVNQFRHVDINQFNYGVGNGVSQVRVISQNVGHGYSNNFNQGFNNGYGHNNNNFIIQRQVFNVPLRVQRIVEVPGLDVKENVLLIRDANGKIVDVRRQRTFDLQQNVKQGSKVLIQENVIKGGGFNNFNYGY